jgi:hypothetical protein
LPSDDCINQENEQNNSRVSLQCALEDWFASYSSALTIAASDTMSFVASGIKAPKNFLDGTAFLQTTIVRQATIHCSLSSSWSSAT